ncbi:RCC1 and BTB domain-containing protein 2 [Dermatophagoides pteronyssinus]|uniref:RCC1 and BTB domain-containing protein 2 n=1 Tax=Dermatophagoides pteronyssinus TaxID=6956 RepID=A0ABQ8JSU3_DERPT|nr:RCC1 and BTB domain-containing protein 2 [Dermatophagoides pteronyssinus]
MDTMSSNEQHSEYAKFNYVSQRLRFDPNNIQLMTKIYNRDSPKANLLSIIWTTYDNKCFAYGHNASGCLGINQSPFLQAKKPTLIRELSGQNLIKLCSGQLFVLALTKNGRCYSWGDNRFGQLGLSRSNSHIGKPSLINAIKDPIVDLACGLHHSLILTVTNHLYSFGSNLTGSVGNGTTFHQLKPVQLTDFTLTPSFGGVDFVDIACGGWHSAAVNLKGEIFVWGWNHTGQCGQDDLKSNVLSPTKLKTNLLIQSVCCGQNHTLMLTYDGKVWAMGNNQQGQCGIISENDSINFTKPILVPLDEPVSQIGAWAKSDISIAKSKLGGKFFIWGSMKPTETITNHNSERKNNLIHKISLCSLGILSPIHQTMNQILANFDQFRITDDRKLLRSEHQVNFPFERILIHHDNIDINVTNNKLLETFNNQNDCDIAIGFGSSCQQFDCQRIIYVQQLILERFNNFFQRLPKSWIIVDEAQSLTPPPDEQIDFDGQPQSLSADVYSTDGVLMTKFIQTLNRQRKRFYLLLLDKDLVNERAMYAYLMFQYSTQKFLIIAKQDLIELLRIAELMDDKLLMNCCLNYIVEKCPDCMEQICSLFSQALRLELSSVMDFCVKIFQSIPEIERLDLLEKIYRKREETFDLKFHFVNNQSITKKEEFVIKCHKLVLFVKGNVYQSFSNFKCSQLFEKTLQMANISSNESIDFIRSKLLRMDCIDLPVDEQWFFNHKTFELFFYHIYHGKFPMNHMTDKELIQLYHLANLMNDPIICSEVIQQIRCHISIENVCHFYSQYCVMTSSTTTNSNEQNVCLDELKQICMETAKENMTKLFRGSDFQCFILTNDYILKEFMSDLSNHLKTTFSL